MLSYAGLVETNFILINIARPIGVSPLKTNDKLVWSFFLLQVMMFMRPMQETKNQNI